MPSGDSMPAVVQVPVAELYQVLKSVPQNPMFARYTSVAVGDFHGVDKTISQTEAVVPFEARAIVKDAKGVNHDVILTDSNTEFLSSKYGYDADYYETVEILFRREDVQLWAEGQIPLPCVPGVHLALDYPAAAVRVQFTPTPKTRKFKILVVDDQGDKERSTRAYTVLQYLADQTWKPVPPEFSRSGDSIGTFIEYAKSGALKGSFKSTDKAYQITDVCFNEASNEIVITVHYTEPPKPKPIEENGLYVIRKVAVTLEDAGMYKRDSMVTLTQTFYSGNEKLVVTKNVIWDDDEDNEAADAKTSAIAAIKGTPMNPAIGHEPEKGKKKDKKNKNKEDKGKDSAKAPAQRKGYFEVVVCTQNSCSIKAVYGDPAISACDLQQSGEGYTASFPAQDESVSFAKSLFDFSKPASNAVKIVRWCLPALLALVLLFLTAWATYNRHDDIKSWLPSDRAEQTTNGTNEEAADEEASDGENSDDKGASDAKAAAEASEQESVAAGDSAQTAGKAAAEAKGGAAAQTAAQSTADGTSDRVRIVPQDNDSIDNH